MGHDLRRRFIFGFTIKNTDMRIWLCDRSRFLTSEPFNFINILSPLIMRMTSDLRHVTGPSTLDPFLSIDTLCQAQSTRVGYQYATLTRRS